MLFSTREFAELTIIFIRRQRYVRNDFFALRDGAGGVAGFTSEESERLRRAVYYRRENEFQEIKITFIKNTGGNTIKD